MHDQFDVTLEDQDLLREVELTTNLIIAASETDEHLTTDEIDQLLSKPWLHVPQAGAILGLNRSASYEAAKRGEIETIRIGRLLKGLTAPMRKKMKI